MVRYANRAPFKCSSVLGVDPLQHHASILGSTLRRVVIGDRVGFTTTSPMHAVLADAMRDQIVRNCPRPLL